ncbi:Hypp5743 [Branchiostoma lanceolatum]|uniref:Hypp5743 protein n=1 Tax=Branchiostoma lanceolatum TaxID=7740 RepID=A0A8J9YRM7_BRALA|nr:Hypp5743 [Branchiostoma lanceolatum]
MVTGWLIVTGWLQKVYYLAPQKPLQSLQRRLPRTEIAVKITVEVKKRAAANLFAPSGALADDDLVEQMDPDAPCPIGKPSNIARTVNRHRQKLRPADPTDMDFEFDESFIPDSFYRGEVTVGTSRHFVFASDDQLAKLSDMVKWYVDGTFKVVKEPFKQLFGFHGFLKSGKKMKQVPLVLVLMSSQRGPDYEEIIRYVVQLLPKPPCVREVVLDFEKGVWNAFHACLPRVVIHGCAFHWSQAVLRHAKDHLGLQRAYIYDKGTRSFIRLVLARPFLPSEHIVPMFLRLQRKASTPALRALMDYVDSTWIGSRLQPPSSWSVFWRTVRTNNDSLLPFKRGKVTSRDKEWITPRIKGLIRERQKAFMSGDTTSFKRLRNKIQHYMKTAKRSFYEKEVDHLKHGDTRKWYSLVKSLMGAPKKREGSLPTPGIDCDSLSEHFSSVWSNVTRDIPSTADVSDQLSTGSLPELSIGQVKLQLKKLNPRKATGDDHIPIWILTTFHEELAPVLCNIYNSCLQQGIFPEQWKSELVVPVPKTSKPKGPEEYRRISLTSCLGKVLESFVRVLLQRDTDHLIHGSQHGFRPGRSTVSALNHITQTWHDALNNKPKMDVHVSFIDFSRAFDTIDHGSLLHSLAIMGVRRDLWCCLRSYLSDRVQRVRWGSRVSSPRPVLAGTPQGGIICLSWL